MNIKIILSGALISLGGALLGLVLANLVAGRGKYRRPAPAIAGVALLGLGTVLSFRITTGEDLWWAYFPFQILFGIAVFWNIYDNRESKGSGAQ